MIHVMAAIGLSRAAMPAAIMGNYAKALVDEEEHLRVPIVCGKRPTVAEDNGLTLAPVFVVDVDVSSVFFSNGYVWHDVFPSWLGFLLGALLTQTARDKQRFAGDPCGAV
jgi:hypothetical protein